MNKQEQQGTPAEKPGLVAPNRRDLEKLASDLAVWLQDKMPDATDITLTDFNYPLGAGLSHETILFDAQWREGSQQHSRGMVVRIKPGSKPVYQDDMFIEQYRLIELMDSTGAVPVAKPLWFEPDAGLLGAPFFVMEKVHGRVAVSFPPYSQQGWLFDSTAEQQRIVWEDSVRKFAAIQTVPIVEAQFLNLQGNFGPHGDQEIDRWERYVEWVDPDGKAALLHEMLAELLRLRPGEGHPEGIVWGDARLGNMMIGPDYKVVAVMDWEQPSLGGALHDLGWWLYTERMQTELRGLPRLPGMALREDTLALWSEVCGKSTDGIGWYEAFAALKMEALSLRMMAIGAMPAGAMEVSDVGSRTRAIIDMLL